MIPAEFPCFVMGLTIIALVLFAGPLTGAGLNPARTFGPALFTGTLDQFRQDHYRRYPRLHKIRLHQLWTGLHLGIAGYGIVLVIITVTR